MTPESYATKLGARLRAIRLQRNITQADLARKSGVSRPTLSALETGGRCTLGTLAKVMYALGRERELEIMLQLDPPSTLDEVALPHNRQRARS